MAQAEPVTTAIRALNTGASAKPSTNPFRAAHSEFVAELVDNPPWPIPIFADATDLQDRADHAEGVIIALSAYLTTILTDTAQNVPGGLDLRQIDALLSDLTSDMSGTLQHAIECTAWRAA